MEKLKVFVGASADIDVNNFVENNKIHHYDVVGYQTYFSNDGQPDEYSILIKYTEDEQMTNTLNQLVEQVEQWSIDKDLHNGNSDRQALKFYEEAGEVASALSRGQMDALKDGIGDTVVTLIILAQQHDMTLQECLQYAYDEIKGRKGKTVNGTFIKESDLKE